MLIYNGFLFILLFILKQLIPPLTVEENKRVSDTLRPGQSYIVSQYKMKLLDIMTLIDHDRIMVE
jgi:hypothetical protein